MIAVKEISRMLSQEAERVTAHLLGSEGKRLGKEMRWGDVGGSAGRSLGVHMAGEKRGVWSDFATGAGGDLLDLWCEVRCCGMAEAISEAKAFLGIRDIPLAGKTPKPEPIKRPDQCKAIGGTVTNWLLEQRRISQEAIKAYRVAESKGAVAFPFLSPESELLGLKYRALNQDKYWAEPGTNKVLFGWQAIPPTARSVLLCEGELKAMAWWDYGIPAMSVPFGGGDGGKQDWIENEFDNLARFDVIHIAMDEDEAGKKAADAIVKRLGPERCAIVKHPLPGDPGAKCINACLHGGVSRALVTVAVANAKPRDPDELHTASDYADCVAEMFTKRGPEPGIRTPWQKVGDELVFRPGELSIIAGVNGHGKSQAVGFMAADAMVKNYRVCVASLEFKVGGWLKRLVRQLSALASPTPEYAASLVHWLGDGRLWAFDAQGTTDWRRMLDVFRYARRRYQIDLFVIDNMTGLGIGEEDYQGQKELTLALSTFARDEDCHVWLVHHIRKGQSENAEPDKFDIKGSGSITDLASTILTVWRNKVKEQHVIEAKGIGAEVPEKYAKQSDVKIFCKKQRNYQGEGNGEPTINLWWSGGSYQYLSAPHHTARPMVRVSEPTDIRGAA